VPARDLSLRPLLLATERTRPRAQWGRHPRDLAPEVTGRIPVRSTGDPRYFTDRHQALPSRGYTPLFEAMLSGPRVALRLSTDFHAVRGRLRCLPLPPPPLPRKRGVRACTVGRE
jgi:UDP-galactopyranose mutase